MDIKEIDKNLQNEFKSKKILKDTIAYKNSSKAFNNKKYRLLEKIKKEITFRIGELKFLDDNSEEIEILDEQLEIIKQNQTKILSNLGLTFESLKPQYECKKCNDMGFIGSKMCDCFKRERNYKIIEQCGISKDELFSFGDIDEKLIKNEKQLTDFKKLKTGLEKWCDSYPKQNRNNIFLSGATGLGKTYLTKCMAKNLLEKGLLVCYVSAFEMNNLFFKYHSTFNHEKEQILIPLLESDVLFIDDLGSEPYLNNVTESYLYLVLSERERFKRPTIITSNFSIDKIVSRYSERIYSRIVNKKQGYTFNISGDDLRINK